MLLMKAKAAQPTPEWWRNSGSYSQQENQWFPRGSPVVPQWFSRCSPVAPQSPVSAVCAGAHWVGSRTAHLWQPECWESSLQVPQHQSPRDKAELCHGSLEWWRAMGTPCSAQVDSDYSLDFPEPKGICLLCRCGQTVHAVRTDSVFTVWRQEENNLLYLRWVNMMVNLPPTQ